jgi:TorA maturation chaperone TorD
MDDDLRRWIYASLGALFTELPERLDAPGPSAGSADASVRAAVDALCAAFAAASPEELAIEQVRLFVNAAGGVAAPPYASWYLDGTLGGPSTAHVVAAYAAQALEAKGDAGQPPDFIAAELEFLHFLCRHQLAARATRDGPALAAAGEAESSFLVVHFTRWAPRFAEAIRSADPSPVFARAADLLDAFCAEEQRRLARAPVTRSAAAGAGAMDHLAHTLHSASSR